MFDALFSCIYEKKLFQLQKWIDQLVSQQNDLLTETDREYIDRSVCMLM